MQMQHQLPNTAALAALSVDGLVHAVARLGDLMADESEAIQEMRFADLPKSYDEKLQLVQLLEAYQQRLSTDPSFLDGVDIKAREQLLLLTDDLAVGVEDNFRRVATARTVNQRVLQAIMDVMSEQQRPGVYDKQARASAQSDLALSMNINQQA